MQEPIDLVVAEEKRKAGGLTLAVGVSMILHVLLVVWFVRSYRPMPAANDVPVARYVELITQNPDRQFVEAPGPTTDTAPLNAPLSNATRKASMPEPTGPNRTTRPGDGSGLYTPPAPPPGRRQPESEGSAPQVAQQPSGARTAQPQAQQTPSGDPMIDREPSRAAAAAAGAIDWRSAIRDVRKVASLGGGDGPDFTNQAGGGELGSAEQGPLSFESSWYDWGDYAQSMVSRIRVNWYAVMPQIIRTGVRGVVTIRFTIHRDGRVTDVTILKSSGVPPYDYAAKKAIEASSPLNRLPADFPRDFERVTAIFYYNTPLPD